MDAFY